MKLTAKREQELGLDDDPRNVRDPVVYHRLWDLVYDEAIQPTWCCVLWRLHRAGYVTLPQRMAGDLYHTKFQNYTRWEMTDPEDLIPEARQLAYKRIERAKREYRDVYDLLGRFRKVVHSVVIDDAWPAGYSSVYQSLATRRDFGYESERDQLVKGLQLISDFFTKGTNSVRNKANA